MTHLVNKTEILFHLPMIASVHCFFGNPAECPHFAVEKPFNAIIELMNYFRKLACQHFR